MVRIRTRVNAEKLHVIGVLGVTPAADRSLSSSRGRWIGMSWELYSKGVRGLPLIHDYGEAKKNGGLEIIPCEQASLFRPLDEVRTTLPGQAVFLTIALIKSASYAVSDGRDRCARIICFGLPST